MTPHGEDTTWRRIGYVYRGDKRCGGCEWTGCYGDERHGGDRGCGGGCNGQDVMVRRDMAVTEVVEEDAMDRVSSVRRDMEVTEVVEEDAMDRVSW